MKRIDSCEIIYTDIQYCICRCNICIN